MVTIWGISGSTVQFLIILQPQDTKTFRVSTETLSNCFIVDSPLEETVFITTLRLKTTRRCILLLGSIDTVIRNMGLYRHYQINYI